MRSFPVFLLAFLLLSPGRTALAQSAVEKLRARLAAEEERLQLPVDRLRKTYLDRLENLEALTSPVRYPHRVALIREEMRAIDFERIAPAGDFTELQRLQEIFDKEYPRAVLERARNLKILLQRYRADFRELESRLRSAGDEFSAGDALKAGSDLSLRLEEIQKRIDSLPTGPRTRRGTGSRPIAKFAVEGRPAGTLDWTESLERDWKQSGPAHGVTDNWTLEMNGSLRVPVAGTYNFSGHADDVMELIIGDTFVGRMNQTMQPGVFSIVNLEAGWHPFTIRFTETTGDASFLLRWSCADFPPRAIDVMELAGPAPAGK